MAQLLQAHSIAFQPLMEILCSVLSNEKKEEEQRKNQLQFTGL